MEPAFTVPASKRHASGIAFGHERLVTGGMEGVLRVWGLDGSLERDVVGHTASVNTIAMDADVAFTVGSDKQAIFWNVADWTPKETLTGYTGGALARSAALLRKQRGDRIYRHDRATGTVAAAVATGMRISGVWRIPGGWAVGGVDPVLQIRAEADLSLVAQLDGHDTAVTSVSCTQDGRIVTSDYGGNIHIWRDGAREWRFAGGDKGYFFASVRPDGGMIATGAPGAVTLWSPEGDVLDRHAIDLKGVYGVCWSDDGKWLANAASDGKVRVYRP